jgi:hypothetical protein
MIPVINAEGTSCIIGDVTLSVNQSVDYKSAIENRTSIGTIQSFKYASHTVDNVLTENKSSVWMRIKDSQDDSYEWISVYVWKTHYDRNVFGNNKRKKDGSSKQTVPDSSPI